MPRRTIKTAANSRRGAKRAKTSPRDENRENAAKTKKSEALTLRINSFNGGCRGSRTLDIPGMSRLL